MGVWSINSLSLGVRNRRLVTKYYRLDFHRACCWLSRECPKDSSFITENVSEIDLISTKLKIIEDCGYKPIAHFVLPPYTWIESYHSIAKTRFHPFLQENNYSLAAKDFVERMEQEIEYYQTNKEYFGYVFFILKNI